MDNETFIIDPPADDFLDRLHSSDAVLAKRVEAALDVLERDPTGPEVRRRQVRPAGAGRPAWGIRVRGHDEDLMILWTDLVDGDGVAYGVQVLHIGPDVLFR